MKTRRTLVALSLAALGLGVFETSPAQAFPGLFVGKGATPRFSHSAQVVVFRKNGMTSVTIMPDYQGPLDNFAWLIPVPADVKVEEVRTLRRDVVDHIDTISAPRFAEFWEMDPCEPGPAEQDWERNLKVEGPGFLGEGMLPTGDKKVPKELLITTDPEFRDSIYKLSAIAPGSDLAGWLTGHGYDLSEAATKQAARYSDQQFIVVEVDAKQIEITGTDRAILSPVRFTTKSEPKLADTLGLVNSKEKQELLVYVIDPTARYQVANYPNIFPPTNLHVDFKAKERMGELYAGLHDLIQKKTPGAFLNEYAWSTKGCGQPCANTPLYLAEMLALGADAVEAEVPDEERNPKPPEMTDEEKEAYKKLKPIEKKELDAQRKEVARRKALMARHESYVLTRLHHRYSAAEFPKDIELQPAPHIEGGINVPKGPQGELPRTTKPAETESRLQTRFVNLHRSISEIQCENRERNRWGKAPRTYRGLRKIWVAQDLATRNRSLFKLPEIIRTAVPELGLVPVAVPQEKSASGAAAPSASAAPPAGKPEKGNCGCSVPGQPAGAFGWMGLLVAAIFFMRRRS